MKENDAFNTLLDDHRRRMASVRGTIPTDGKRVGARDAVALLESVLRPGDRVVIEGNNQKQATFLAGALARVDPAKIYGLHMLQSSVSLDDHIEVFRQGIAARLDFAFSGPQAVPLARLAQEGRVAIGAIHTYPELYGRYFTDLPPKVALVCAEHADCEGNLYLGHNAEETPLIVDATHSRKGIVIAQVETIVDRCRRVDIPGDQVEFVVETGEKNRIDALFTRDPARITHDQILQAMMVIKGIYAEYGVQVLNHGIGYATAAIELLLPTYADRLGLKGKIGAHWVLNPHPTLIPAIEAGFVRSIYSFGSEPGMDAYIAARGDVFYSCHEGVLRSNRALAHMAGHYGIDLFIGATLQMDADGNSSTATRGRISGFGGAPNLGCNAAGRRHVTGAWARVGREMEAAGQTSGMPKGRKLVVQVTQTVVPGKQIPVFVEELDAVGMARDGLFEYPPVMIYAEDITHVVTERGIACLCRCHDLAERRAAIRAVAGDTPVGRKEYPAQTESLRKRSIVRFPADLGLDPSQENREWLAARDLRDLQKISGGLYHPPGS